MKTFTTIWFGQLVSLLGSGLTAFTLSLWVYQRTSSVTQFALVLLVTAVPRIVLSPFAGVIADRWDRRHVMIASDLATGLGTLAIYFLVSINRLDVWHILLATAFSSSCNTFQNPAFRASIGLLVSEQQLGRANGMQETSRAISQLLAPLLGGFLFTRFGLQWVLVIDMATFVFAVGTLLMIRIPRLERAAHRDAQERAWWYDIVDGWRYLVTRQGLLALMIFFTVINCLGAISTALLPPLVINIATADTLGMVMAASGGGLVAGGFLMSLWGGPKRRTNGVFGFVLLVSPFTILAGLTTSVELIAVGAFGAYFMLPFCNGFNDTLLQSQVPPEFQGRVFGLRQLIGGAILPVAYIVAGPLADGVFEPLMAPGGFLATHLGHLLGVGPGRGVGVMFILIGISIALATLFFYVMTSIRHLEDAAPDTAAGRYCG